MKRTRTRIAEAIAIRGIHREMEWIHELGRGKNQWSGEDDKKFARWIINKEIDKPKIYLIK